MDGPTTLEDQARHALAAYEDLTALGEEIEDEWSFVNDLSAAWTEQVEQLIAARGGDSATPEQEAAVERAIDEISRIDDPHRAIDWLSTFPQIVLVSLGAEE
jgi:hypothetical protein